MHNVVVDIDPPKKVVAVCHSHFQNQRRSRTDRTAFADLADPLTVSQPCPSALCWMMARWDGQISNDGDWIHQIMEDTSGRISV